MATRREPRDDAEELMSAVRILVRRLRARATDGELSMRSQAILRRLDTNGPTTSGELARAEAVSPQAMGTTIAPLEAQGLLSRSTDPADGRRIVLTLTDAGRQVLRDRRNSRTEAVATAMAALTDDERARLTEAAPLIARVAQNL
ncbi:MarR family winged helix-turn-helix transcriptional regulator [Jongsikchunia kroppenstedtii]|uniref:MarR family winged helix-turn-helix transcriptional regulator n=1 Tax=Jongsikchunia kroppenstedtii TaxID=1121721 RepID=UPI000477705B|nr:MarR family transcriptional regulator [Jongsikchunia kroppenstedtii]